MARAEMSARRSALGALAALFLLCLLMLPSAAIAQTRAAELKPLGDTIKDAGKGAAGSIEEHSNSAGRALKSQGRALGQAIDDTSGTEVGSALGDAAAKSGETVKDSGSTLARSVEDTGNTAGDLVNETLDEATGPGGPLGDGDGPGGSKNNGHGQTGSEKNQGRAAEARKGSPLEREATAQPAPASQTTKMLPGAGSVPAAALIPPLTVAEAIQRAIDAAKAFAFPIALVILVAGFIMVQNRIDRKDPRLALAAVDTADELLSFS